MSVKNWLEEMRHRTGIGPLTMVCADKLLSRLHKMWNQMWTLARISGVILVSMTVLGCVTTPARPPTIKTIVIVPEPDSEPQTQPVKEQEVIPQEVIPHALETDAQIITVDQPWALVERSKTASDQDAPALLIRAINTFLDYGKNTEARSVMETLMTYSLTFDERLSLKIIQARLAAVATEHAHAIELLSALDYNEIRDVEIKKQALDALANSQIALGYLPDAALTLLNIDRFVTHAEQLENQQRLVRLVQTMNVLQHALLREKQFNLVIDGWLALVNILATTTPILIDVDLENWRQVYPNHPAQAQLIEQYIGISTLDEYQQIALLLPLTSSYGAVAQAFYDGFMRAHNNNIALKPPRVILYDVGEEASLSSLYYQAAINKGADFVVGPIGRKSAEALLSSQQLEITTLLIAEVPADNVADNVFGLSLSPEKEARQTADKAFAEGHRQATVLRNHSKWGERVANAFVEQWQSLGGVIVKNKSVPKGIADYTRVIQKFLGLDKSTARKRLLEAQLDTNLQFTARRNDDMDMLFLAAHAEQARLIVPQLHFFQAHDLPMYAISYVYSGNPDPVVDADLDGLIFGDMRWMLEDVSRYKAEIAVAQARKTDLKERTETTTTTNGSSNIIGIATANASLEPANQTDEASNIQTGVQIDPVTDSEAQVSPNTNPYKNSALNRLYALGIQSYQLIPRLNLLRNNTMTHFFGKAMTVRVDPDGSVVRLPVWAKFVSGLAEPYDR